jgi:hypothetical protein
MLCDKVKDIRKNAPRVGNAILFRACERGAGRGSKVTYTGMPCSMCRQNEWEARRAERKYLSRRRWMRGGEGSWERVTPLSGFTKPTYW